MERLIPYAEAAANGLIVPGMAAFKVHLPGTSGYDLSSQYKPGGVRYNGDVGDYCNTTFGAADENGVRTFTNTSSNCQWIRISGVFGTNPIVTVDEIIG